MAFTKHDSPKSDISVSDISVSDFSVCRFLKVHVVHDAGFSDAYFSGYRLFSVRDQGMGLGLRSGQ